MSELSAHEVLVKARNLIDREGLVKGEFRGQTRWLKRTRGYCVRGAILEASGVEWTENRTCNAAAEERERPAILPAYRALVRYLPPGVQTTSDVARWNNATSRTKGEVLAAFDRAISSTAPAPADPLEGVEMAEVVA